MYTDTNMYCINTFVKKFKKAVFRKEVILQDIRMIGVLAKELKRMTQSPVLTVIIYPEAVDFLDNQEIYTLKPLDTYQSIVFEDLDYLQVSMQSISLITLITLILKLKKIEILPVFKNSKNTELINLWKHTISLTAQEFQHLYPSVSITPLCLKESFFVPFPSNNDNLWEVVRNSKTDRLSAFSEISPSVAISESVDFESASSAGESVY